MTGKNKTRMVGWHPRSADLEAQIDAEIARRGGGRGAQSDLLDEVMTEYFERRKAPPAMFRDPRNAQAGRDGDDVQHDGR